MRARCQPCVRILTAAPLSPTRYPNSSRWPAARGLSLETEIEAGLTCRGEEALLRRLTAILLDNAVKYCDPDGTIRVRLYRRHHPVLLVENTCAQVDALELDRLFDRFYRADKARTFSGSFGIGLSIAQSIASQYHPRDPRIQTRRDDRIPGGSQIRIGCSASKSNARTQNTGLETARFGFQPCFQLLFC